MSLSRLQKYNTCCCAATRTDEFNNNSVTLSSSLLPVCDCINYENHVHPIFCFHFDFLHGSASQAEIIWMTTALHRHSSEVNSIEMNVNDSFRKKGY